MQYFKQLLLAALATGLASTAQAEPVTNVADAIKNGEFHANFRYRLERVDQDGLSDMALASTLRSRFNYATAPLYGASAFIEVDNIAYIGTDSFNNTRNGKAGYPVVADPDATDINQLYFKYAKDAAAVTLGRQRINLDNQRFVGGVGWRQNEQTYDAVTAGYNGFKGVQLVYAYVDRVARVFGPDNGTPDPTLDTSAHVLNAHWDGGDKGAVTGYGYFLDVENAPAASSRTGGVRYTNHFAAGEGQIPVAFEFARQTDYGNNPVGYAANYTLVEVGYKQGPIQLLVGNEVLGADTGAGVAFATPLATLHKFQGWADKFLSTPAAGVDDRYVTVSGGEADTRFTLTWHDFNADAGSAQYGNEWDMSVAQKLGDHVDALFKYASYNANTFATDTTKFWVMMTVHF